MFTFVFEILQHAEQNVVDAYVLHCTETFSLIV